MKEESRFNINDSDLIVWKKRKSTSKSEDDKNHKQNMTLGDIVTPNSLDTEVEKILGSVEDEVMKALRKTKYFDHVSEV